MKIPYSWFKELLPDVPSVPELVEVLDSLGLAVEEVAALPAAPEGVVVARVERVTPVTGSDHLLLAGVTDGSRPYQVVTGAPNTREGMLTALAKPGAQLLDFTVTEREMAGVRSEGVLCSPRELGLYDHAAGLIDFGDDLKPGDTLAEHWPEETVLELELTPNRADAFSLLGVARDVAAKLGILYRHPAAGLELGDEELNTGLAIRVEDEGACPRFTLRLIEGVTVKPSPIWLQRRLAALGLRPRNNIVDVTNYVTYELGQPSHAYDRNDLRDGTIVVRRAQAGEALVALDEEAYEFSDRDLLITTPSDGGTQPIGIAGVIGGLHHSVKKETRAVALEVAHFDPVTVRKTAKRLGLSTDASHRFERGVDPNLPPLAAARAASLIAELAGGTLHEGLVQVGQDAPLRTVLYRPSRVAFLMALEVPLDRQRDYLVALGCTIVEEGDDRWEVTAPSWRFDLAIEEDLVEEVSRLHGYDSIPITIPAMHFVPEGRDSTHRNLRSLLVGFGLQETLNYTFSSDDELAKARAPEAAARLQSPPSAERSVLRTALYPGLLGAARTNRPLEGLALFEVGHVFLSDKEEERLGILLSGDWVTGSWLPPQQVDVYVLKGVLEKLAATLGLALEVKPQLLPHLHPGVSGSVLFGGQEVGWLGQVHPEVARHWELERVFVAELTLPLDAAPIAFTDYGRQPHAERDLAIIAPQEVTYAKLSGIVRKQAGEKLESLWPFDVYEGEPIPSGQRSVALRLRFRDSERALRDEEVDRYMGDVIAALRQAGYNIRDRG